MKASAAAEVSLGTTLFHNGIAVTYITRTVTHVPQCG